jgi:hypothetical protein
MARRTFNPLTLCLFLDYAGIDLRRDHEGRGMEEHQAAPMAAPSQPVDALDDAGAGDDSVDVAPDDGASDAPGADDGGEAQDEVQAQPSEFVSTSVEIRRLRPNGMSKCRVDPDAGLGIVAARARRSADIGANYAMVKRMVATSVMKLGLNVDVDETVQDLCERYIESGKVWDPSKATFKTLMQWAMKAQFRNSARRYLAEKKVIDHATTDRMVAAADAMDKDFNVGDMGMKGSSSAVSMASPMGESSRAAAYAGEHGAVERIHARRKLEALAHVAETSVSLTTMLSQHHPAYTSDEGVSAANARQRRAINAMGQTVAAMAMAETERGVAQPKIRDPYIIVPMDRAVDVAPKLVDEAMLATAPTAAMNIAHLTETGEGLGSKGKRRGGKGEMERVALVTHAMNVDGPRAGDAPATRPRTTTPRRLSRAVDVRPTTQLALCFGGDVAPATPSPSPAAQRASAAPAPMNIDGPACSAPTAAMNIAHLTETGEGLGSKGKRRGGKGEPSADIDVERPTFTVPLIDTDATSDEDAKWRATVPLDMPPVVKLRSPLRRRSADAEQP